jgi:hypothetical protein
LITLVFDITGITEEDVNLILFAIITEIMLEEDLDLENIINFVLVSNLNDQQWQDLLPNITAKITIKNENTINHSDMEDLIGINGNGNNYSIFPDWNADQERLASEISKVLTDISEEDNCSLLVNLNNMDRQEVVLFFSDVAMNLMLEEDIDLSENINLSFVNFTINQWKTLTPLLKGKLTLSCEYLPDNLSILKSDLGK